MTKFDTTKTKNGYKILSLHGPDEFDCYSGVVEADGSFIGLNWGRKGDELECQSEYDLILLDEPSETTELWNEIETLREITVETLKRMDEMRTDYIARVNGLRNDYLADQSAVQPSRVDALEERLEALEQSTQPSEKGVWVTAEKFWGVWCEVNPLGLTSGEVFQRLAKRLGFEE